jgi:hypothetical protein
VYFGYTLRFLRHAIGTEGCLFNQYRRTFDYLAESARKSSVDGTIIYRQYHQDLPSDTSLIAGTYKVNPTNIVCTVRY